jgi:hypothetical protein
MVEVSQPDSNYTHSNLHVLKEVHHTAHRTAQGHLTVRVPHTAPTRAHTQATTLQDHE